MRKEQALQAVRSLSSILGQGGGPCRLSSPCSPHLESRQGRRMDKNKGSQGPGTLQFIPLPSRDQFV